MKVRDLERLLWDHGVSPAKIDGVTRKLREIGRLPLGGRGPNAPDISPRHAATILISLAASGKANEADSRLMKMEGLPSSKRAPLVTLLDALEMLLSDQGLAASVVQVRIARTIRFAQVIYVNGDVEEFKSKSAYEPERFWTEAILPGALLTKIASTLAAPMSPSAH